jgi:hypothetical protein
LPPQKSRVIADRLDGNGAGGQQIRSNPPAADLFGMYVAK